MLIGLDAPMFNEEVFRPPPQSIRYYSDKDHEMSGGGEIYLLSTHTLDLLLRSLCPTKER